MVEFRRINTALVVILLLQFTVEMWWYIVAAVGLAALLIVIVAVIGWKKTKGGRTRMDDRIEQGLNPAVTQPSPENTADREEDVSYASVQSKEDDDEDDLVTYSTVKAPSSSSAGASADPSDLYATVNKPTK
ncbi:Protein Teyrha-meyrha [Dissostichus eleginoides]|uniref:Protein Teyrha-meyrha n=1 Tax=Dissostichus eleginoides TaxID=100907 RepID=A0AAD9BRT1_DISEL|nr:Protein Teyrha-meyrha [Dissostichus eleginoides]